MMLLMTGYTITHFLTSHQTNCSYSGSSFTRSILTESLDDEQKTCHLSLQNITLVDGSCYKIIGSSIPREFFMSQNFYDTRKAKVVVL